MLAQEENELITDTNPGTPMGEVFRRFWLPVALAEEVSGIDSIPARLLVMGEELIAFRDADGRVGLVDAFCPHRGAPLFFGRNEESGLRCVYHGWKFDVDGVCTDLPSGPEGDTYKDKVQIKHYPVVEAGDLIWAYMGPRENQPPSRNGNGLTSPESSLCNEVASRMQLPPGYGGRLRPDTRSLPPQHPRCKRQQPRQPAAWRRQRHSFGQQRRSG